MSRVDEGWKCRDRAATLDCTVLYSIVMCCTALHCTVSGGVLATAFGFRGEGGSKTAVTVS